MTNRDPDEVLLSVATDRFERRLSEEGGKLRGEIGQLRVDMVTQGAEIRSEMAAVRVDMAEQFAAARVDSAAKHRDLLKWALMFWVAQAASVAGIVSAIGFFFARR